MAKAKKLNWFMRWFYQMASFPHFYRWAGRYAPWLGAVALLLIGWGTWGGLVSSPPDYQMGDGVRIMFVHVPSAWLSMMAYTLMAVAAGIGLIWRIKLAYAVAASCAPIGAAFTFLTLASGSLWGKPMWGTWWEWDARMTSELLLLFLFLGYMGLRNSFTERDQADRVSGMLAVVGVVNVPIIHFSVEWWNTLHQPASVTRLDQPAIDPSMLVPLLVMTLGFTCFFAWALLTRTQGEILLRARQARWVDEL
ncbi:MAG: heme ABC transporter permease [Pseudomonadota bacterium]